MLKPVKRAGISTKMPHIHVRYEYFQNNVSTGFAYLQQREEFVDMTLAADGHTVKVHKNILALASPYIKEMLQAVPCPHPVLFLNNVTAQFLHYILEYIYTGEVVIPPDDVEEFFKACKFLHIAGISNIPSLPKKPPFAPETDFMNRPTSAMSTSQHSETQNETQIEHENPCEDMNNDIINIDSHVETDINVDQNVETDINVDQNMTNIVPALNSYPTENIQESEIRTYSKNKNSEYRKSEVVPVIDNHTITDSQDSKIDIKSGNNYHKYDKSNLTALENHPTTKNHPTTNLLEAKMDTYGRNDGCQYVDSNTQPVLVVHSAIDSQNAEMDTHNVNDNDECQYVNLQPVLVVHPAIDSQVAEINRNDECQYLNSNMQPVLDIHVAKDSQEAEIDKSNGNVYKYIESNAQPEFESHLIKNIQENEMCTGNEYNNESNYVKKYSSESKLKTKGSFTDTSNNNLDQLSHNYNIEVQIVDEKNDPPQFVLRQVEEPPANTVKKADLNEKLNPLDLRTRPIYTLSKRGALQMIFNRYLYNMHFSSHGNRRKRWRCIDYRLHRCMAIVDTEDEFIIARKYHHLHPYHDDKIIAKGVENNVFGTRTEATEVLNKRN